jgi:hypothetical protein
MMKDMHEWLIADEENGHAVHCLAGHGRTGVIIAAFFLFEGLFATPDEAIHEFANKRSKVGKGIKYSFQHRHVLYASRHFAMCHERNLDRYHFPDLLARILATVEFQQL